MTVRNDMLNLAREAKSASRIMATLSSAVKDELLLRMAEALEDNAESLMAANEQDLTAAREKGLATAMIDRLALDEQRIGAMAGGLREVAALPDPVGEITGMRRRPNGIQVGRMRIPLGVIGIIFESRPNVTADAAALCLKSGNAVILRGGSEAFHSNNAIGGVLKRILVQMGLPAAALQVVATTDRQAVLELLKLEDELDLVIPRGGEGLIRFVSENSRIPVIKHYKGVCHLFIDASADYEMATKICVNAKVQRPGVCNAAETLLIHKDIAETFVPQIAVVLTGLRRGTARLPDHPRIRPAGQTCQRGGLGSRVPRVDPGREGRGRPGRGDRSYPEIRLPAHRIDRHPRLRQRPALPAGGELRRGDGQCLHPLFRRQPARAGSGDRHFHHQTALLRSYGTRGSHHPEVHRPRRGADKAMKTIILNFEFSILNSMPIQNSKFKIQNFL